MQAEIFSDAYAIQHGYGEALIPTLYKQNGIFEQQVEYRETRIEKINSKEFFDGTVLINESFM